MSSLISTTESADLHTTFQSVKAEIQGLLDKSEPVPIIANTLNDLKRLYEGQIGRIPKYDQRQYELAIRELEGRLSILRAAEKPRAKFSFTKKPQALQAPRASSSSSSSSSRIPISVTEGVNGDDNGNAAGQSVDMGSEGVITSLPSTSTFTSSSPASSSLANSSVVDISILPPNTYTLSDLSYRYITPHTILSSSIPDSTSSTTPASIPSLSSISSSSIPTTTISTATPPSSSPSSSAPSSYTLSLSNLQNCIIDLRTPDASHHSSSDDLDVQRGTTDNELGSIGSLHCRNLSVCVIITPQMGGSALLHDMKDCLVIVAAQQFRMHTSQKCTVLLHITSAPVIEHCSDFLVGQYPSTLGINLDGSNRLSELADFDWVRPGPSPNWRLLLSQEAVELEENLRSALRNPDDVTSTLVQLGVIKRDA